MIRSFWSTRPQIFARPNGYAMSRRAFSSVRLHNPLRCLRMFHNFFFLYSSSSKMDLRRTDQIQIYLCLRSRHLAIVGAFALASYWDFIECQDSNDENKTSESAQILRVEMMLRGRVKSLFQGSKIFYASDSRSCAIVEDVGMHVQRLRERERKRTTQEEKLFMTGERSSRR